MKYYVLILMLFQASVFSQNLAILSQKKQSEITDAWLSEKLEHQLPVLMDETGIDMWLIISREYNEDPIIKTLLPSTWLAARRRTMLVIFRNKKMDFLEKIAVSRYDVGKHFKKAWNPEENPNQWKRLVEIIAEKRPAKIGVNISDDFGHADGLNHTEYELLKAHLPDKYQDRLVSAEDLAVKWLETRTKSEMQTYRHIQAIAHDIIKEGLSEKVITPGVTTTTDVVWWFRDKIASLGLQT